MYRALGEGSVDELKEASWAQIRRDIDGDKKEDWKSNARTWECGSLWFVEHWNIDKDANKRKRKYSYLMWEVLLFSQRFSDSINLGWCPGIRE